MSIAKSKLAELQSQIASTVKVHGHEMVDASLIKAECFDEAQSRFALYQEAYQSRMIGSLREDFSEVEAVLGHDDFHELALKYLNEQPSRFSNLAEFSLDFPKFLGGFHPHLQLTALESLLCLEADLCEGIPERENLSADQISNGIPFTLRINPSLHRADLADRTFVAYRSHEETCFDELNPSETKILNLIQKPLSLDDLARQFTPTEQNQCLPFLSDLIRRQLVYCHRVGLSLVKA